MEHLFLLLLALLVAALAAEQLEVSLEERALTTDDACLADPTGQQCGVWLLQLRGAKASVSADDASRVHNNTGMGFGFCCYEGASADTCGRCYKRAEPDHCDSEARCGGCGGTWCVEQCVLASANPNDICSTAYKSAIAGMGEFCAESEHHCSGCGGSWCGVSGASLSEVLLQVGDPGAKVSLVQDVGGDAMYCVFSSADSNDVCSTAYLSAVATADDYCALSEERCTGCGGSWCGMDPALLGGSSAFL